MHRKWVWFCVECGSCPFKIGKEQIIGYIQDNFLKITYTKAIVFSLGQISIKMLKLNRTLWIRDRSKYIFIRVAFFDTFVKLKRNCLLFSEQWLLQFRKFDRANYIQHMTLWERLRYKFLYSFYRIYKVLENNFFQYLYISQGLLSILHLPIASLVDNISWFMPDQIHI